MNTKVSTSNTKAQILKAYDDILKKLEEKSEAKPKEVQQRKDDVKTVESAQKNNESEIISSIAELKNSFIESLDKVQDDLTKEYVKLSDIQIAIKIEKKNLEDLYGLSTNADSFAALLLAQKESREKFDEESNAAKEMLNAEITETKANWQKEKLVHDSLEKEEKILLQKTRKREEEEYDYNLLQKRKKEVDAYQLTKFQQEADLKDKKLSFEKDFAEREKNIVETEKEFASLKKAAEQFPAELENAIQQATAKLEKQIKLEYKFEKELVAKETEGIINLKDLQVQTLENKIKEMDTQIKLLGQKADISEKSVKDIALKAIENTTKLQIIEKDKQE